MPLMNAKCTNCGGALQVDSKKRLAVCPYCKEPYVVEEAINNYTYTTNNYINADVVNVTAKIENDFVIRGGVLEKYNGEAMDVVIPNGVVAIKEAFKDCIGIRCVTIPDSVKTIGYYAFYGCKNLKSVTLPDGLEEIGDWAFGGCSELEIDSLPDSITAIGNYAFKDCSKLKIDSLPDSITVIGNDAFGGCASKNVKSISIAGDHIEIGNYAFKGFGSLERVTMKGTNIKLGWYLFSGCPMLEEIALYGASISQNDSFEGDHPRLKTLIISAPTSTIERLIPADVEVIGPLSMRNKVEEHMFTPIPPNQLSIQNLKNEQLALKREIENYMKRREECETSKRKLGLFESDMKRYYKREIKGIDMEIAQLRQRISELASEEQARHQA